MSSTTRALTNVLSRIPADIAEKALTDAVVAALRANDQLPPQAVVSVGHNRGPPLEFEPALYSIASFCQAHGVSRSALYKLWRLNIGPRVVKLGKAVKISREAAAQWRFERQAASDQAVA
jgi:predicted DNA-binding transcriptional regulator AlpA